MNVKEGKECEDLVGMKLSQKTEQSLSIRQDQGN